MSIFNEVIKSTYDVRDFRICAQANLPSTYKCPIDIPVKNQKDRPTCVAHAAAVVMEYHHVEQHKEYVPFSTMFIYGYRGLGYAITDGMMIRNALNTMRRYGDCFEVDCPGNEFVVESTEVVSKDLDKYLALANPHRISSYFRCKTADEIKTALMTHGPVLVSMNVYDGYKFVDDCYTWDSTKDFGRHCVVVYGWDERGWLIQNSWGPFHAGDGKFVMPFNYKFNEAWGVTDNITDNIKQIKRGPILDICYKFWNWLINLWNR